MRHQWLLLILLSGVVAACGGPSPSSSSPSSSSPSPEASGGAAGGDIPDNAVFLTYTSATLGFSIEYVEGWQVKGSADSVVISDKDSSETVLLAAPPSDIGQFVTGSDLPALKAQAGFRLVRQDSVVFGQTTYLHLAYELLSPPDPVTGKQVKSSVDRYYVAGSSHLAIVSLATPTGVDNVDAFHRLIASFKWL